jgi:hypothetical protein
VEGFSKCVDHSKVSFEIPQIVEKRRPSPFERAAFEIVEIKYDLPRVSMSHPLAGRQILPPPTAAIIGIEAEW